MLVQIDESGSDHQTFAINRGPALDGLRSQRFDLPIPDSDISHGIQLRLRIHYPAVQDDDIEISCHEPVVGAYQNAKAGKKHDPAAKLAECGRCIAMFIWRVSNLTREFCPTAAATQTELFSREFVMPRCGAMMKTPLPRGQGGLQGGRPSQIRHDNPLKASRPPSCSRSPSFRLLSPFGKGDFQRTYWPVGHSHQSPQERRHGLFNAQNAISEMHGKKSSSARTARPRTESIHPRARTPDKRAAARAWGTASPIVAGPAKPVFLKRSMAVHLPQKAESASESEHPAVACRSPVPAQGSIARSARPVRAVGCSKNSFPHARTP